MTSSGSASDPSSTPAPHYFSEEPGVGSDPTPVQLVLPDLEVELMTDRGVFAAGRIDPGTTLLLSELTEATGPSADTDTAPDTAPDIDSAPGRLRPESVVVDLGCGSGAIACVQALRHPGARVLAIDVNRRARELSARNAEALGVRVQTMAPEDVPHDLLVDHLVSNPPIRIGKPAVHALLGSWLDRLSPVGVAHLVVAKHLGADSLARWMQDRGHPVERLRSRRGYRILEVRPATR